MTFADCRLQAADRRPQTVTSSLIKQRQKKLEISLGLGPAYEVDFSRVKLQQPRSQVVFGCKVSEEMASTDSRYDSFFFFLIGYRCMKITSSRLILVF